MKTTKKEKLKRDLKRAEERIRVLSRKIMDAPPVPLKKRIFVGHWRFFRVREDVLRSSIGEEVSKVVGHTNHWVLGKKKFPKSYRSSTEVMLADSIVGRVAVQYLNPLTQEEMDKTGFGAKVQRKWFSVFTKTIGAGSKTLEKRWYFPKVPEHMLEFGYKAAYITETHIPDGDVESELHHLRKFMDDHNGWEKLHGNHRDEWDLSLSKKKTLERLRDKEVEDEVRER